jgi:hypothetical protein
MTVPGSLYTPTIRKTRSGYQIDQSIRFNSADSSYMTRTPSAGNRKTFTVSFWARLTTLDEDRRVFTANADGCELGFLKDGGGGNRIRFYNNTGSYTNDAQTTAEFRDVSRPYHVVLRVDTTQATDTDRVRIYVNGVLQTLEATTSGAALYPPQNTDLGINTASAHYIGRYSGGANRYFNGNLSEFVFIDGTSYAPTDFGNTDAITGQWVPIAFAGAYGTNGFYITGENSADLGADYSGNGNNFTSSGLTSTDQLTDTPTDNYATFNVIRTGQTGITLTDGALQASAGAAGTRAVAADIPIDSETTTGYYAEIKITALAFASPSFFGLVTPEFVIGATAMYASSGAYVYNDSAGATYANGVAGATYTPIVLNDVVQFAVKNGNVYVGINNTWVNSGDPVAETGAVWTGLSGLYSFCWEYHRGGAGTNTHTVVADFGQSGFAYTPPTGYSGVSTATLPDPPIADPSAHMQTTLYTGTGSSLAVTQSGNSTFQPDLVWIKGRSGATEHVLTDAVRGVTKELSSNDTGAEETVAQGLTAFGSAGFTVGTDGSYNTSSATYVGWQWKANGAGSSNTDGSINTTATSVNTTAGFSISTYTGTGSAATIGHGLGIAPKMVIVKKRVAGTDDAWIVWHASLPGANYYLNLNDTGAQDTSVNYWNNTLPTSSVFSVGASNGTNENTKTFVAYCFAEVEGFSKIGSYTGNGSADGPFVYCGFQPRFLMLKDISNAQGWAMYDTARGTYNPIAATGQILFANLTTAESSFSGNTIDVLSNGFKIRANMNTANQSGATIIYMAFAEYPFKYANAG